MTQPSSIPLFTVQQKSQLEIRDDILRTLSNHLRSLGIPNPNVGPNSDYYGIADGVANEIAVGQANGIVNTDNLMPDTAGGSFLDRWLAIFGLARRSATQSAGVILPAYALAQGYTLIPLGAQLVDTTGQTFTVLAGGSYGPGDPPSSPANLYVPVQSVTGGATNDHANGDVLQWVSIIPYVSQYATVGTSGGTDGLSGGNDSEATQDEPPRSRLYSRLQFPLVNGNWPAVAQMARDSSPDVSDAGVYPALLGPASIFFAAWAAPQTAGILSSTSKSRELPAALINGTVVPFVQAQYPARAVVVGASVVDQPVTVSLLLSLPAAVTAQPAGPGGGWVDGTPWPSSVGGTAPCEASSVISSTSFAVNATSPPQPGISHVAYVSQSNWQLYTALVLTVSGSTGAYTVTIDTPWPNLAADWAVAIVQIFPQAVQQLNYLAAVLQAFANLGPGEWTTSVTALVRAFRHPSTSQVWFSNLDANFLRTVENSGQEVLSAQFLYRTAITPTVPSTPTITSADPFTLTSAAPNVFTPKSIGWYAQ